MAESKRNSMAARVATPKTAGAATPTSASTAPAVSDPLESLGKSIGARIKLTTTPPHAQTYEGTLFTACPTLNIVALNTRAPSPTAISDSATQPGDYHVIPVSRIQSFQVASLANGGDGTFAHAQPPIAPLDTKKLQERERTRIHQLQEEERNRGKGVTKEAQAIFDSFKRINMPVRWHEQEMIVYDAVIIAPPYRVEDCKGAKDKQESLNRVRKVLEGERRKLQERERKAGAAGAASSSSASSSAPGPRKGG